MLVVVFEADVVLLDWGGGEVWVRLEVVLLVLFDVLDSGAGEVLFVVDEFPPWLVELAT